MRIVLPTLPRGEIPSPTFVTTSGGLQCGESIGLNLGGGKSLSHQWPEKPCGCIPFSRWLERLPQETIVFDGASFVRRTQAEVALGSRLLASEMLVLGRKAMGEKVVNGLIRDGWAVRQDGRLAFADNFHLEDDLSATVAHPAGLGGAVSSETIIFVADDVGDYLDTARELLLNADDDLRHKGGGFARPDATTLAHIIFGS